MKPNLKKALKPILVSLMIFAGLVALYRLASFGLLAFMVLRTEKTRYSAIIYDHPLADKSFITDEPCRVPCWHGLIPGVSSYSETKDTIYGLDCCSHINIQKSDEVTHFSAKCPYITGQHGTSCAIATVKDDLLISIKHVVAYTLTFEDAVVKLGSPDQFNAFLDHGSCYITLQWINEGVEITHSEFSDSSECIEIYQENMKPSSSLAVREISYVIPDTIQSCNENSYACYIWEGFRE